MLLVPEGKTAPEGLDDDILVVQQPVNTSKSDNLSVVGILGDINGGLLDKVRLLSTKKSNAHIKKAQENSYAMIRLRKKG